MLQFFVTLHRFSKSATFDDNASSFDGAEGCAVSNDDDATVMYAINRLVVRLYLIALHCSRYSIRKIFARFVGNVYSSAKYNRTAAFEFHEKLHKPPSQAPGAFCGI